MALTIRSDDAGPGHEDLSVALAALQAQAVIVDAMLDAEFRGRHHALPLLRDRLDWVQSIMAKHPDLCREIMAAARGARRSIATLRLEELGPLLASAGSSQP